jgi:CRP-like cAMP-binding protein
VSTVRLLDVEPGIGRFLTPEERDAAGLLELPVRDLPSGSDDVDALLVEEGAFGALVLSGMLSGEISVNDRVARRLLGVGDLYLRAAELPELLTWSSCRATKGTRLALLDDEILIAVYRWPRIVAGLLTHAAEQSERVAVQLAISHLPHVEERLVAIMSLIAERWGYVTPRGTVIPVPLTHETLGSMIGARRPTVSIALGSLAQRDVLVRHHHGWLLRQGSPGLARSDRHDPPGQRHDPAAGDSRISRD